MRTRGAFSGRLPSHSDDCEPHLRTGGRLQPHSVPRRWPGHPSGNPRPPPIKFASLEVFPAKLELSSIRDSRRVIVTAVGAEWRAQGRHRRGQASRRQSPNIAVDDDGLCRPQVERRRRDRRFPRPVSRPKFPCTSPTRRRSRSISCGKSIPVSGQGRLQPGDVPRFAGGPGRIQIVAARLRSAVRLPGAGRRRFGTAVQPRPAGPKSDAAQTDAGRAARRGLLVQRRLSQLQAARTSGSPKAASTRTHRG